MIYVEFTSRRPQVSLADFHAAATAGQEGWEGDFDDTMLLNAGRTWRLGPEPEYMTVWETNTGFDRIDDWDRIFRSGEVAELEDAFRAVARIDAAGCYEAVGPSSPAHGGTYYIEFFRPTGSNTEIADHFARRAKDHVDHGIQLAFTLVRIGRLAPEPGGMGVWVIPDFASLSSIASDLEGIREPIELVTAGTYADWGQEIL